MTLPWDDNGYRVLPAAAYMDHTERMRSPSKSFPSSVEEGGSTRVNHPLPPPYQGGESPKLSNQFTPAINARRNAPKSMPMSLGKRTRARIQNVGS